MQGIMGFCISTALGIILILSRKYGHRMKIAFDFSDFSARMCVFVRAWVHGAAFLPYHPSARLVFVCLREGNEGVMEVEVRRREKGRECSRYKGTGGGVEGGSG